MANENAPFGFRPWKKLNGDPCIASNEYTIASALNETIGRGALVKMSGTGTNIQLAGTTDQSVGVFHGVQYVNAQGKQVFSSLWTAATVASDIRCIVYDDPDIIFVAQCDTLAAANVGALADHAQGTTNTLFSESRAYINVGAGTATTGMQIRIRGLADGEAYGSYANVTCTIYQHALRGEAGAGV